MKFTLIASALALATAVAAAPQKCLTQQQANTIIYRFSSILKHQNTDLGSPNATAQALIANDYTEESDSILSLEGAPLGGLATTSKAEWINGILSNPPDSNITTYAVYVAGCTHILWQWKFDNIGGPGAQEVKGFNLLDISPSLQVCKAYIEFNSIAWGTDTHQLPAQCYAGAGGAAPNATKV